MNEFINIFRVFVMSVGGLNVGLGAVVMIGFVKFVIQSDGQREEVERFWGTVGGLGYTIMMAATIYFIYFRLGEDNAWFSLALLAAYLMNISFCLKVAFVVKGMRDDARS